MPGLDPGIQTRVFVVWWPGQARPWQPGVDEKFS